jgi:hypothetical protein
MSALPPKADIAGRQLNVRFVPKADIAAPCRAFAAWLLIAASLVLTLAASTVRSNRAPIGVGDPEEVEPQAHSAGELILSGLNLSFR